MDVHVLIIAKVFDLMNSCGSNLMKLTITKLHDYINCIKAINYTTLHSINSKY
jgi:hypothetical protein